MDYPVNDTATLTIRIPSEPIGKQRARGKNFYTPPETRRFEDLIQNHAREAMDGCEPVEFAIKLDIRFLLSVPASWPKWKRTAAYQGLVKPTSRPDLDNLTKAIMDGFNGVVWRDDAQVFKAQTEKVYSACPETVVTVKGVPTITTASEWAQYVGMVA